MKFLRGVGIGITVLVGIILGADTGAGFGSRFPTPPSHIDPRTGMARYPLDSGRMPEGAIVGALAGGALLGLACWSHAKEKSRNLSRQLHSVDIEVQDSGGYSLVE